MGSQFSRNPGNSVPPPPPPPPPPTSADSRVQPDLSSYEAACRADPDLQSFDSTLQERTGRVISSLAVGDEVRSLSLDSLREVTGCLLEMNQEVVKVILDSDKDIWKDKELCDVVEEYFDHSLKTLDFCNALENCLKFARDRQFIIQLTLQKFEEEQREASSGEKPSFSRTLQELKIFKTAGNPFTEEFFTHFQSVYNQQLSMLKKLQTKKTKLDHKLNSVKAWRKVFNVIFAATFASVLICSIVAAAITAPPVVTALAAAASVPLGSMGSWFNSIWKKYESEIRGRREMIRSIQIGTYIVIKDMDNIRVLVEKVVIEMEALLENGDLAMEEGVVIAVGEIKKKVSGFIQSIDDLCEHSDKLSRDIRRQRTVILQRIIKRVQSYEEEPNV